MIKIKDELVVRGGLPNLQGHDRILQVADQLNATVIKDKVNQQAFKIDELQKAHRESMQIIEE